MSTTVAVLRQPDITQPRRRISAIVGAVLLLALDTTLANRVLPGWAYPVCGTVTAVFLIMLARWSGLGLNTIGLDRQYVQRAAIVGLIGLGLVALAFGTALAVPALRAVFYDGRVGAPGLRELLWLALVRIPLGTIALEEVAFRGVLPALFGGVSAGGGQRCWGLRRYSGCGMRCPHWHCAKTPWCRRLSVVCRCPRYP